MVTPGQLNRRAQLFEQLSAMITAGVPLTKALEQAGTKRSSGFPQKTLQELTHHLQEGHTFSDAMQIVSGQRLGADGRVRPGNKDCQLAEFDIALLSAGEESGRLDSTFRLLARYYASRAKIIRDTIASLLITVVTLHVFLLVFPIGFMTAFVLGLVNNQFSQCLPFILEKLVVFGALYGSVFFLVFACQGNRGEGWRALVESFSSVIPMLRSAVKYLAVARLALSLHALLNAGVHVVRSWELSVAACGSPRLKREVSRLAPQLETGLTPAEMVAQIRYFPDMFAQLYQSGEISGKLDETLTRLHTYFEDEGFRKLQMFCRVTNFAIYFSIAILIGISIIRFYVGYFNAALNAF